MCFGSILQSRIRAQYYWLALFCYKQHSGGCIHVQWLPMWWIHKQNGWSTKFKIFMPKYTLVTDYTRLCWPTRTQRLQPYKTVPWFWYILVNFCVVFRLSLSFYFFFLHFLFLFRTHLSIQIQPMISMK